MKHKCMKWVRGVEIVTHLILSQFYTVSRHDTLGTFFYLKGKGLKSFYNATAIELLSMKTTLLILICNITTRMIVIFHVLFSLSFLNHEFLISFGSIQVPFTFAFFFFHRECFYVFNVFVVKIKKMEYTGSSYEGEHLHGRLEGQGEYTFPTGTVYKGGQSFICLWTLRPFLFCFFSHWPSKLIVSS